MEQKKIPANHVSNMGLTSKYVRNLYTHYKTTFQFKNWQRNYIDIFPKKAYKWPIGI